MCIDQLAFEMSRGTKCAKRPLARPLDGRLGHLRTRRSLETRDEAMDIAQYPEISDQRSLEREDRRAVPPDMPSSGLHAEELFAVIAMEPELPEDLVSLFSK